jgi:anthranilate phosphoribosyltransferase
MIREAIAKIADRTHLSREESRLVMEEIASGEAPPTLIAAFLASLRTKGETIDEIAGFAQVMREKSVRVSAKRHDLIDICGTGGDGRNTFNISTTVSFVIAGAGCGVAKHGNRKVSSSCGSADILESLGVEIDLSGEEIARCIDEVGIGFLFAQKLHPAMKHAAGPRRELGMKTIFNVLGPLTNPALVKRQLMGVFDPGLLPKIVRVLAELGAERALVVHAEDGLDEISISSRTTGYHFDGRNIEELLIDPADYGFEKAPLERITVHDLEESKKAFLSVLHGEDGPARDVVLLNAGAALFVGGIAGSIAEGIERARKAIDGGSAAGKFEALRAFSRGITAERGTGKVGEHAKEKLGTREPLR